MDKRSGRALSALEADDLASVHGGWGHWGGWGGNGGWGGDGGWGCHGWGGNGGWGGGWDRYRFRFNDCDADDFSFGGWGGCGQPSWCGQSLGSWS